MLKKFILVIVVIGAILAFYNINNRIQPNKKYIMICNNTIAEINIAKETKDILYNANDIQIQKPLLGIDTNYCKVKNNLYISSGRTYVYSLETKKLHKAIFDGNLVGCIPKKELLVFEQNEQLFIYNLRTKEQEKIGNTRNKEFVDWLYGQRVSIVKDNWIFFNDKNNIYKYDIDTKTITKTKIKHCDIINIKLNNGLLCLNSADFNDKVPYFYIDLSTFKQRDVNLGIVAGNAFYYDNELNGIFYIKYDWDWYNMKETKNTWFYSFDKNKSYFVDKECHF